MQYNRIQQYYFSATGTTQKVVRAVGSNFVMEATQQDLLKEPLHSIEVVAADTLVILGMPVFSGRIPVPCVEMLENLKGMNTPAIAVVVYGNRDYDDALRELCEILQNNGFLICGAGAFVAQHSIFPKVAAGRPDNKDRSQIVAFAKQCAAKLAQMSGTEKSVQVKGNLPVKPAAAVPLKPTANKKCNACGICARVCPSRAINATNPCLTNNKLCIACAACIAVCPQQARAFRGIPYKLFGRLFQCKFGKRREPETFI